MEIVYLRSPTGLQHERAISILSKVKEKRPHVTIVEIDPNANAEFAKKFHIKYSPGIVINGKLEFVGIPREKMFIERIDQLSQAAAKVAMAEASGKPQGSA